MAPVNEEETPRFPEGKNPRLTAAALLLAVLAAGALFAWWLVPLTDARTGAVVAVLGMDIDARAWRRDVAARAALPVGLMLVLLIGVAAVFALPVV
jgi:hypothetical protein